MPGESGLGIALVPCPAVSWTLRPGAQGAKRGFTLVELLVVVAIIATLIALLLPTLARAKYVAKETACMSNLREIGIGLTAYAVDNSGWYPKRGATRNAPYSLGNGRYWDVKPIIKPYFGGSFDILICPLMEELITTQKDPNAYNLFFDTRGNNQRTGSIGDGGPVRILQYDIYGNVCADSSSLSQFQTWYWPNLISGKLMRRLNQPWTKTHSSQQFNLLASDRCTGRGYPPRSRQSNHPEPSEFWTKSGLLWQGESRWNPATSANYLDTGGSVRTYRYKGIVYYFEPMPEPVVGINGVGYVPQDYIVE